MFENNQPGKQSHARNFNWCSYGISFWIYGLWSPSYQAKEGFQPKICQHHVLNPDIFQVLGDRSSWIPETGPYSELLRRPIGHLNLNLWALATFLSSQRRCSTQNLPISCPKSGYFSSSWRSKFMDHRNRTILETLTGARMASHFEFMGSGHLLIKPKKVFNPKSANTMP